eukprot:760205-Hanusia_phi.AAC.2
MISGFVGEGLEKREDSQEEEKYRSLAQVVRLFACAFTDLTSKMNPEGQGLSCHAPHFLPPHAATPSPSSLLAIYLLPLLSSCRLPLPPPLFLPSTSSPSSLLAVYLLPLLSSCHLPPHLLPRQDHLARGRQRGGGHQLRLRPVALGSLDPSPHAQPPRPLLESPGPRPVRSSSSSRRRDGHLSSLGHQPGLRRHAHLLLASLAPHGSSRREGGGGGGGGGSAACGESGGRLRRLQGADHQLSLIHI